jgi:DNA repair exonuclease SbcCD ATPase subunit
VLHVANTAMADAAAAISEAISIQRAPSSLTKNMISPIVRRTPLGSVAVGHGCAWPDPKVAPPDALQSAGPDFQNYERLVAQRDAKIGILEKQVEVLQGALREKGLDEAEQTLTGLLSSGDHLNHALTQMQAELEGARKETQQQRENVDKLKKKQLDDIAELRKMYEDVVHESERHQQSVLRLEEEVQQKDEALRSWQRSHGELENELDQTIVKVTQLQNAHSRERECHLKEAEMFHKSMLEHTKQLDIVRKDRDNVAAELHALRGVLEGHEGVVSKLQAVRKEEERARERLSRELEATQAEANKLREEVVILQNQAVTHKVLLPVVARRAGSRAQLHSM